MNDQALDMYLVDPESLRDALSKCGHISMHKSTHDKLTTSFGLLKPEKSSTRNRLDPHFLCKASLRTKSWKSRNYQKDVNTHSRQNLRKNACSISRVW